MRSEREIDHIVEQTRKPLETRVAQLIRTIEWASDRLRHGGYGGKRDAVITEVIDTLNKAIKP